MSKKNNKKKKKAKNILKEEKLENKTEIIDNVEAKEMKENNEMTTNENVKKEVKEIKEKVQEKKKNRSKKRNFKSIISLIILILVMLLLIILGVFGIYSDFGTEIASKMPAYKYSDIFTPYDEYVLTPSASVMETDAYVDKDGKTVRRVPQKDALGDVELSKDNEENKKKEEEKPEQITPDEEVKEYKIEKRKIADNPEEVLTEDNYKISKNMIEGYLKAANISEYKIKENEKTGQIIVSVPETKKIANLTSDPITDETSDTQRAKSVESILSTTGSFEVKDSITGKVYLTEKHIKEAKANIYQGYGVILDVKLNDEGKKILSDVSRKYVQEEKDGKKYEKKATVTVAGMELVKATFAEPMDEGLMQINLGNGYGKNKDVITAIYGEAKRLENALKVGKTPIKYNVEQKTSGIKENINYKNAKIILIAILAVMLILALSLVFKYGLKGLYAMLVNISFVVVLLLAIRYTDVVVTIPSLVSVVVAYILEYVILLKYLRNTKENDYEIADEVVDTLKYTFILIISSITLSFSHNILLSSFAMTLFIAIILLFTHNYIFVKNMKKKD